MDKVNYLEGKVAKVAFLSDIKQGKKMLFDYINSDVEVEVGDTVVVSTRYGDKVARVIKIETRTESLNYVARIIGVITDFTKDYKEEKRKLYNDELDRLMNARRAEILKMKEDKSLAEIDDKFKELYEKRYEGK